MVKMTNVGKLENYTALIKVAMRLLGVDKRVVDAIGLMPQLASMKIVGPSGKLIRIAKQAIDDLDEHASREFRHVPKADREATIANCEEAIAKVDSKRLIVGALKGARNAAEIIQESLDKLGLGKTVSEDVEAYQSALVLRVGTLLAKWVRTKDVSANAMLEGVAELLRRPTTTERSDGTLCPMDTRTNVAQRSNLILPDRVVGTVGKKVDQKPIVIQGRAVRVIEVSKLSTIEILGEGDSISRNVPSSSLATYQYSISTAFWGGDYSQSALSNHDNLVKAIAAKEYNIATLTLSNLLLIYRSKGDVKMFDGILRHYLPKIQLQEVDSAFLYRLWKELFVHYYETGNLDLAQKYVARMRAIDSELSVFTPADDWLPGTIRWRKAHLDWRLAPSVETLDHAIILAREGVQYLSERIVENPNSAGLASGYLNLGWLYFIKGDPGCISYFEGAQEMACGYTPRTLLEAQIAEQVGRAIMFGESVEGKLSDLQRTLRRSHLGARSYSFLERHSEWSRIKRMTSS